MKAIIALVIGLLWLDAHAATPEAALGALSPKNQTWVNQACPRSFGPSLWSSCVLRESAALRAGVPDISRLNSSDQAWIHAACPTSLGPSLTISCLRREKAAVEAGMPSLSKLSAQQRAWVEQSCPKSLGPSLYRSCAMRESNGLSGTNRVPSAPTPRPVAVPRAPRSTAGSGRTRNPIEVAHNDVLLVINGVKLEAKTYCLGWDEGDSVVFLEGSAYGACASAKVLNLDKNEICDLWCE
jgi:hypothetical protein